MGPNSRRGHTAPAYSFILASGLSAAPIQWSGNGHYYDLVTTSVTWAQARSGAQALSHLGQQGYLVTVTSADEMAFLAANFGNSGGLWAGGTDSAVEGEWRWADGPEANVMFWNSGTTVTYANWNGGEPNNVGNEDGLIMFQFGPGGGWNDAPLSFLRGYIVEFDEAPPSSAVPEPTSMALLGGGLAALVLRRRRSL